MENDLNKLRLRESDKKATRGKGFFGSWFWRVLTIIVFLLGIGFLFQAKRINETPTLETEGMSKEAKASMDIASVSQRSEMSVDGKIMAGGYIEANRLSRVFPGRDGVVAQVFVREGQHVKKDDLLAALDTSLVAAEVDIAKARLLKAQAQLAVIQAGSREEDIRDMEMQIKAAEATYENARDLLARRKKLDSIGVVTKRDYAVAQYRLKEYEAIMLSLRSKLTKLKKGNRQEEIVSVKADVIQAEAALKFAQEKLSLSYLKAPFDGVVLDVELHPGEALSMMTGSEGRLGIILADTTNLYVKVDVPESKIAMIRPDMKAEVLVDALGKQPLTGRVDCISPIADRQSNTVEISVRIENPPPLLRPNMSARISISPEGE